MDEHLMNDEQFLAHQMKLARVADNVDEGMDGIFGDGDDIELDNLGAHRLQNPIDRQSNDQAGNGGVAQDGHQNAGQDNNQGDNQAGHPVNNHHDGDVAGQHNRQVINPGIGRGNRLHLQPVLQAHNNAAAGNGNNLAFVQRNVGFGDLPQPRPLRQQDVFQPYPQGHAVFRHQQNLDPNIRYPSGFRHQRLLTPVEATRAARLKSIIDNLEYELQRNREVYRRLYGPIPGGQNRDAG